MAPDHPLRVRQINVTTPSATWTRCAWDCKLYSCQWQEDFGSVHHDPDMPRDHYTNGYPGLESSPGVAPKPSPVRRSVRGSPTHNFFRSQRINAAFVS